MSDEHRIQFGTLSPDGTLTNIRMIKQSSIMACPHMIIVPEHYNDDESCKCLDESNADMASWGYKWSKTKKQWV